MLRGGRGLACCEDAAAGLANAENCRQGIEEANRGALEEEEENRLAECAARRERVSSTIVDVDVDVF